MRRLLSTLLSSLLVMLLAPAATAFGQVGAAELVTLEVRGSPFVAANEGGGIESTVALADPAELRLRVVDFNGQTVRELYAGTRGTGPLTRVWRGRDDDGDAVPNGAYRVIATASAGGDTERAAEWVTVADRKVYPRRPGFITVVVDPGHGGRLDGAVGADGTREADINLDIGRRLARMLEGAGVNVVITRTTDAFVNTPEEDRTGDGVIDADDELAARPDMSNEARADLFISVHNNNAVNTSVGGPSTYFYDERPFGGRSARLARIIQEEMVAALNEVAPGGYEPYDHGTLIYPYYVLRGYDPPRLRRPTQMPGVLSEGMFLSNERELRLLKRPVVRQAMADGYYDAISKYLARRASHIGYALIDGPEGPVTDGDAPTYRIEVRNHGNEDLRGWDVVVGALPKPPRYVGRARDGEPVGKAKVPRLAPGERTVVDIDVAAPDSPGEWMLMFDARDPDRRRASSMGSPRLQVPLTTTTPADPSPDASLDPTPSTPPE